MGSSTAASATTTLTFANGQYPPANAFWSVTMYDGKTRLLIAKALLDRAGRHKV